ncbi:MAG: hypothetical protein IJZ79_01645 [Bacilli bacterium]|nr:hypothetical protein [Bacilli bacterium]
MIDREYYLNKLSELKDLDDIEAIHVRADDILLEILLELGYKDIVDEYNTFEMWYA